MTPVLDTLCDLIVDCEHKTAPPAEDGEYPLIRTPDIGVGRLLLEKAQRVTAETYRAWTKRAVPRPGDLILAREAPVGNVGIVREGIEPALGQRTVLIRPDASRLDPFYLNYLLSGPALRGWMEGVSIGATVPHLNMADIRSMVLPPVPPLLTQRKIAAILCAYDDLIENNTRRIKILEEMAHRIYHEWFVEFRYPGHEEVPLVDSDFGLIPRGWTVSHLRESVELLYGKALKADDRHDGNVPVFGSGGSVGFHDRALVDGPGIVVGRKGNVGSVMWCHTPFFPIDTTYYVKTQLPMTYAFFGLGRLDFIDSHAAVPGLSREQAYALPWVTPDAEVLSKFDQLATAGFGLKDCLERTNEELHATRDLLLPRLISGEIAVDDFAIRVPEAA